MADTVLRVDTREFERTRKQYMEYTKRDLATVLNTKGFFIARRATLETPKASIQGIWTEFGAARNVRLSKRKKQGKYRLVRDKGYTFGRMAGAVPRLAAIINARRAKKGKPGLEGSEMREAMNKVFAARLRSVAYLKSGWLPAIAQLEPLADRGGKPPMDRSGKIVGKAKGGAVGARPGFVCKTQLWNTAYATREHRGGFEKFGLPALQRAYDFETASMREYMYKKILDRARKLGIRATLPG